MKNKLLALSNRISGRALALPAVALVLASSAGSANATILTTAADAIADYDTEIGTALAAMIVIPLAFVLWKIAKRIIAKV